MKASTVIIDKYQRKNIIILSVLFFLLFLLVRSMYWAQYNNFVYKSDSMYFHWEDDTCIVFSNSFAGIYSKDNNSLTLEAPIRGQPPRDIGINVENKTISGQKYKIYKRFNTGFCLNALFKNEIFLSNMNTIENSVKKIKEFNNVIWYAEEINNEIKKSAHIVNSKGDWLLDIRFSKEGDVESVKIKNSPKHTGAIRSFFSLNKALSLQIVDTNQGNSIFYAKNGTLSCIKNKINTRVEYFEVRLYGSAGISYSESFLTDFEIIKDKLKGDKI